MDEQRLAGRGVRAAPPAAARRSPTACSARSARPTTPCRRRGCGSAASDADARRQPRRLADDGGRRASASTCCARAARGARTTSARGCPSRSSASDERPTPSTRRCSPTPSGSALLVVLETLTPAERLAFVLHDMFGVPVRRDRADRRPVARPPRASSRAAPAGACAAPRRRRTPTWPGSARSSTRSSPRRGPATSRRWSRCSIRTSCSASTPAAAPLARPPVSGAEPVARQRARARRAARPPRPARRSSTAPPGVVVAPPRTGRSRSSASPIAGGRIVAIDLIADPEKLARVAPR